MRLSRRGLLVGAAGFAFAGPAAAKSVELNKAFPYLDAYLKLPPAERSRFSMAYYVSRDGKRAEGLKAWIVEGSTKTPVPIGVRGRVGRLPTLAQLQSKSAQIVFDMPDTAKLSLGMNIEPNVRPTAEMDADELAQAVAQAAKGVKKAAGPMGFAAPKLKRVAFFGGSGGQAVFADGRARPLPPENGAAIYEPAALKGATTLRFDIAPEWMMIA